MKLRIQDITADAKVLNFAQPEMELNRLLELGPGREFHVAGPIAVNISSYRAGTDVFVAGRVVAEARVACARCLEDFVATREREFRYVLTPRVMGLHDDKGGRDEDVELSSYAGEEIDLSPLVREQMILALSSRALCDDNCRGLCPHCGQNLNLAQCACRVEIRDQRLAALKTIAARRSS
ncbi:MAG: YceD family protein [Candidatus Binataceae bacterium]